MTFDDLERPYRTLLYKWCIFRSSLTVAIWKKIDVYCRQQKCSPSTLLSDGVTKVCVDIRASSAVRGFQTTVGWLESAIFFVISVAIYSETLELKPILFCSVMKYGYPVTL